MGFIPIAGYTAESKLYFYSFMLFGANQYGSIHSIASMTNLWILIQCNLQFIKTQYGNGGCQKGLTTTIKDKLILLLQRSTLVGNVSLFFISMEISTMLHSIILAKTSADVVAKKV
jgi:hypothetical protein